MILPIAEHVNLVSSVPLYVCHLSLVHPAIPIRWNEMTLAMRTVVFPCNIVLDRSSEVPTAMGDLALVKNITVNVSYYHSANSCELTEIYAMCRNHVAYHIQYATYSAEVARNYYYEVRTHSALTDRETDEQTGLGLGLGLGLALVGFKV